MQNRIRLRRVIILKRKVFFTTLVAMLLIMTTNIFAAVRYVNLTLTYDNKKHDYNAEEVFVAVDGDILEDLDMPPIILNDYTLVPAREVFEAVGADVDWNKDTEQVYVKYDSNLLVIPIDSENAYINGVSSKMQTAAKIINNKTMIPLRFVSTSVGFGVGWNDATRVANIITTGSEETTETVTEQATEATTSEPATVEAAPQETTASVVNVSSISLSTSNSKDIITIEGDGEVNPEGTLSSDKTAFYLTIPNAKLSAESANLGSATYINNGFFYQNGKSIDISLTIKENIAIENITHYGTKTVVTLNYSSAATASTDDSTSSEATVGYDTETRVLTLCKSGIVSAEDFVHSDDYYNEVYTLTVSGDFTGKIDNAEYNVNDDDIKAIYVDVKYSETQIIIDENRIMACDIYDEDGYTKVKIMYPKEKYDKIIVLDAGHGGYDPGASGQGLVEKDLTLSMLLKAKEMFDEDGTVKCYVTRAADTYPTFDERTDLGNEVGDAFISIHINSAEASSATGTETYAYQANDKGNGLTSQILAQKLLDNLLDNLGTRNRGVKSANFIVLRQSEGPASLIEIGFITNSEDAAIMGSEEGQQKVAKAVFDSVTELFDTYTPVR